LDGDNVMDKRHPILVAMKERVDLEYAQGRNTVMSDIELEDILRDIDYEFYKKLEHINMRKNFID
ncbi:MAG: hypothetical protein IIX75_00640, partial [Clostridia bacterium]|nr:hypothetical protein [Clostridia bacterium]